MNRCNKCKGTSSQLRVFSLNYQDYRVCRQCSYDIQDFCEGIVDV